MFPHVLALNWLWCVQFLCSDYSVNVAEGGEHCFQCCMHCSKVQCVSESVHGGKIDGHSTCVAGLTHDRYFCFMAALFRKIYVYYCY
jgi:hypothetical protein